MATQRQAPLSSIRLPRARPADDLQHSATFSCLTCIKSFPARRSHSEGAKQA